MNDTRTEWIFTPEQAAKIKNSDPEAIYTFLVQNDIRLQKLARTYARKHNGITEKYLPEDMLQGLFVDLPHLSFASQKAISCDICNKSFAWAPYGGYAVRKSQGLGVREYMPWERYPEIDSLDMIVDLVGLYAKDPEQILIAREERRGKTPRRLVAVVSPFLTEKQAEFLYFILCGYSQAESARKLGISTGIMLRIRSVFSKRIEEVTAVLESYGIRTPQRAEATA